MNRKLLNIFVFFIQSKNKHNLNKIFSFVYSNWFLSSSLFCIKKKWRILACMSYLNNFCYIWFFFFCIFYNNNKKKILVSPFLFKGYFYSDEKKEQVSYYLYCKIDWCNWQSIKLYHYSNECDYSAIWINGQSYS